MRLISATSLALVVLSLCGCGSHSDDASGAAATLSPMDSLIIADRESKDTWFAEDENSPLSETQKQTFEGLQYYPLNRDFRVLATLDYLGTEDTVTFATSDTAVQKQYLREVKLTFALMNETHELYGFGYTGELREKYPDDYFLPFTDNTTGKSTYEAGRYMEVTRTGSDTVLLDFNTAYSPFCAYSDNYACPLVPLENHVPVAIAAGEKDGGLHD